MIELSLDCVIVHVRQSALTSGDCVVKLARMTCYPSSCSDHDAPILLREPHSMLRESLPSPSNRSLTSGAPRGETRAMAWRGSLGFATLQKRGAVNALSFDPV